MGLTALVMAGGKGRRMKLSGEKPLLEIGNISMIERVVNALKNASGIDRIVVLTSKHTPKTFEVAKRLLVECLETLGENYISDVQYAVRKLKLGVVLTVAADLPLITGEIVDEVLAKHEKSGKPSSTVMVPFETCGRLGLRVGHTIKVGDRRLVPVGLNVIDGRRIDESELDQEIIVIDREELAVNVNDPEGLKVAQRLSVK